jgi:protein-L-isoaspartate(D-aspartate) O-methyltransferase
VTTAGPDALVGELRPHVGDQRVLEAIRTVPRERFVPVALAAEAWENRALPIGQGQTISQPLVVARMCELLELSGAERVLDVGTGSGYHAAILARLSAHVWSIERHAELSEQAARNLAAAGVSNVSLLVGDGALGLVSEAPFDAINVAASAADVPPALAEQLAVGARLVLPVGDRLVVVERTADGFERRVGERVRFVPLI